MKAILLYWSVTGTTKRVAEAVADGIRSEGVGCDLHDLRTGAPADVAGYDLVGIGTPVHYYRVPEPVRAAIRVLGGLRGRPVFAFTLNATYRGAGLNRLRAGVARTGAREIGVHAFPGEGRFIGYSRLGYQFSPGHPTDEDLAVAGEFGAKVVRSHVAVLAGEALRDAAPRDPRTHVVYALERLFTGPRMARGFYSRFFRADPDLCIRCGKCVRVCPTANISMERGELPVWGRSCVICGTCAEVCPEEAVRCPYDWWVFAPFMRHNVRRAVRDGQLEHAHVELRRGKVTRV